MIFLVVYDTGADSGRSPQHMASGGRDARASHMLCWTLTLRLTCELFAGANQKDELMLTSSKSMLVTC